MYLGRKQLAVGGLIALLVVAATLSAAPAAAPAAAPSAPSAAPAMAVWTPAPVSHIQTGTPNIPLYYTVWGIYINGKVCMIRFSNSPTVPRGKNESVDSMGCTPPL
jgi:hypothetical protein